MRDFREYLSDIAESEKLRQELSEFEDALESIDKEICELSEGNPGLQQTLFATLDVDHWLELKREQMELELKLNDIERKILLFEKSALY